MAFTNRAARRIVFASAMGFAISVHAQAPTEEMRSLWKRNSCTACHAEDQHMVGPSFNAMRDRYSKTPSSTIAGAILNGSKGRWGAIPMPASPGLDAATAEQFAAWFNGGSGRAAPAATRDEIVPRPRQEPTPRSEPPRFASQASSSRPSWPECFERIKDIQRRMQSVPALQAQKALFEGECAGHPQSQSYVTAAQQALRDAANQPSGSQPATTSGRGGGEDAAACLKFESKSSAIASYSLVNHCPFAVEAAWCFEGGSPGDSCQRGYRNLWTIGARGSYPIQGKNISGVRWGACKGRNTFRGQTGSTNYTCDTM
jgi:cytochrome c